MSPKRFKVMVLLSGFASLLAAIVDTRGPYGAVGGTCLLVLTGWTLVRTVFPAPDRIGGGERIVLGIGIGCAGLVLGGLMLSSFSEVRRSGWLMLTSIIFVLTWASLCRAGAVGGALLPDSAGPQARVIGRIRSWRRQQIVPLVLAVAIGATAVLISVGSAHRIRSDYFTELWITPSDARAAGGSVGATVGVRSAEKATESYHLIVSDSSSLRETWSLTLAPGATWDSDRISGSGTVTARLFLVSSPRRVYRTVTLTAAARVHFGEARDGP